MVLLASELVVVASADEVPSSGVVVLASVGVVLASVVVDASIVVLAGDDGVLRILFGAMVPSLRVVATSVDASAVGADVVGVASSIPSLHPKRTNAPVIATALFISLKLDKNM
jgi:hypothetical protein